MTTLSFVEERGKGRTRLERTTIEVMAGLERHCWRTTLPMLPVEPVRMIFILKLDIATYFSRTKLNRWAEQDCKSVKLKQLSCDFRERDENTSLRINEFLLIGFGG